MNRFKKAIKKDPSGIFMVIHVLKAGCDLVWGKAL
jgi:hypothetical protein